MIQRKDWEWLGQAGHFCAAKSCRYHLHTHVGNWCISTVGEYFPPSENGEMESLGGGGFYYETMVFELADGEIIDHSSGICERTKTRDSAQRKHMDFCFQRDNIQ